MPLYVHSIAIYNTQVLETAQVPDSRWVDKEELWYINTTEYYLAVKKKETLPSATGPGDYYA